MSGSRSPPPVPFAPDAEERADLVYVSDAQPGIRRHRRGKAFAYRLPDGGWLRDPNELVRIRRLAIPPAWRDVWICPDPDGHLQATGRDARGRKQYRYHERWREIRDEQKFERLAEFGRALPRIRLRVTRDLAGGTATLPRERVLATIVRLLDTTFVRVGNEEYARDNDSYGLTTLRRDHADVEGGTLRLQFRGKSGVLHALAVDDPRVAAVVRRCQQMPGQELFHYEDDAGNPRGIGSGDVNDYLREISGGGFTAKDFRTWHGTVLALELVRAACFAAPAERPGAMEILKQVAHRLRNTVAVCRKAYIHPEVLALGKRIGKDDEALAALWSRLGASSATPLGLRAAEWRLLRFLEEEVRKDSSVT